MVESSSSHSCRERHDTNTVEYDGCPDQGRRNRESKDAAVSGCSFCRSRETAVPTSMTMSELGSLQRRSAVWSSGKTREDKRAEAHRATCRCRFVGTLGQRCDSRVGWNSGLEDGIRKNGVWGRGWRGLQPASPPPTLIAERHPSAPHSTQLQPITSRKKKERSSNNYSTSRVLHSYDSVD